jgi:hypothetical protein
METQMIGEESLPMLRRTCEADVPLYLLVDPLAGDILPQIDLPEGANVDAVKQFREAAWGRPVHLVELTPNVNLEADSWPYLVAFEGMDDPWLETSLDLAREEREAAWNAGLDGTGHAVHRIGGWLQTKLAGEFLAALLARWMNLETEGQVSEKYLRLADARVLGLLIAVLGVETVQAKMGRLRRWLYLDAQGNLRHLETSDPRRAESTQPLRLSREQWFKMTLGPVIHGAIARSFGQWRTESRSTAEYPETISSAAAIQAARRVVGHRDQAANMEAPHPFIGKIRGLDDQAAAVALSLLHPGWDTRDDIRDFLEGIGEDETLSARCNDIHILLTASLYVDRPSAPRRSPV